MSTIALSGSDSLTLNNHIFNDLATGTVLEMTFPNDIANVKTGKNGNSIYGLNETGKQSELKVYVIRGSTDDKFLNNLLTQQQLNFAGTVLLIGQVTKKLGDGAGNITSDTYVMSGGVFTKIPEVKTNVEGEAEQSTAMYTIKFSNAPRVLT